MADMQQQVYELTGGNDAQNRYMNYYNQFRTQLSGSSQPTLISAQTIELPREMQAQQISAPEKIQAERINVDRFNVGEMANELDKYFQPYLQDSMRRMRENAARQRASVDVDAYSRGLGSSSWDTDSKMGISRQLSSDMQTAMSEYLNQLGQQALSAWDANENRWLTAEQQNANLAYQAAAQNAAYENAANQFNANALMSADQFNINNLLSIAMQNAANAMTADQFNANAQNEWQQWLEQLAWGRAGQMYETNPVVNTEYVNSNPYGNSGWDQEAADKIYDTAAGTVNNVAGVVANSFANAILNGLMGNTKGNKEQPKSPTPAYPDPRRAMVQLY